MRVKCLGWFRWGAGRPLRHRALFMYLPLAALISCSACTSSPYTHGPERTSDDDEVDLVRTIPGYGGSYIDGCNFVVHLTNPATQGQTARAYFGPAVEAGAQIPTRGHIVPIGPPDCLAAPRLILRKGRYDFAQLGRWHRRLEPLWATAGVVFTDIDETRNRIVIGVPSAWAATRARMTLVLLDVPREAVIIERSGAVALE